MHHRHFLQQLDDDLLLNVIRAAERKTSAELRVFISHHRGGDPINAAWRAFDRLGMYRTVERNAVLIFITPRARRFAVIGDRGIHDRAGQALWDDLAKRMAEQFAHNQFTTGLLEAIAAIGDMLAKYFPAKAPRENQLSDDVAFER